MAFFQWANAAVATAPHGRRPLLLNMDETSLAYHFCGLRGTVVRPCNPCSHTAPKDKASLNDVRGHVSYLSTVANDVGVQALLPQVLLGNEHKFTRHVLRSVACPAQIHLWRQKSAWNSHSTMRRYLCLLAKCLGNLVKERYVVLLVDTAKVHIHISIYKLALQKQIRLLYVPAKMTRWLQPLDVYVFGPFKAALQENWRCAKAVAADGNVDTKRWLQVIFGTIAEVIGKVWSPAFAKVGVTDRQSFVASHLLGALGWTSMPLVPATSPSVEEARKIFPSRMRLDILSYIHWVPACKRVAQGSVSSSVGQTKRRRLPPTFSARYVQTLD